MAKKKAARSASRAIVLRPARTKPDQWAVYRKAVPDPAVDPLALESFMVETNGGGSSENVPGFDAFRAITAGFDTRRVAGPSVVLSRPDGGFFSQGDGAVSPMPRVDPFTAKPENVIGVDSRVRVTETSAVPLAVHRLHRGRVRSWARRLRDRLSDRPQVGPYGSPCDRRSG